MRPEVRLLAYGLALSRVAVGSVMLAAPGPAMKAWIGADRRSSQVRAMGMAIGSRDLLLGVGTLQALRGGEDPGIWVQLGALADAADGLATFEALRTTPADPRMLIGLFAAGFAGLGWVIGRRLEAGPQPSMPTA